MPPAAPCTPVLVTTITTDFGYEQSWRIDGTKTIVSNNFENNAVDYSTYCLGDGNHTITLLDSYGDGWSSGSTVQIDVGDLQLVAPVELPMGSEQYSRVVEFYVGASPPTPPVPPLFPPGLAMYDACELHVTSMLAHEGVEEATACSDLNGDATDPYGDGCADYTNNPGALLTPH
jgi:hypothetical protein